MRLDTILSVGTVSPQPNILQHLEGFFFFFSVLVLKLCPTTHTQRDTGHGSDSPTTRRHRNSYDPPGSCSVKGKCMCRVWSSSWNPSDGMTCCSSSVSSFLNVHRELHRNVTLCKYWQRANWVRMPSEGQRKAKMAFFFFFLETLLIVSEEVPQINEEKQKHSTCIDAGEPSLSDFSLFLMRKFDKKKPLFVSRLRRVQVDRALYYASKRHSRRGPSFNL